MLERGGIFSFQNHKDLPVEIKNFFLFRFNSIFVCGKVKYNFFRFISIMITVCKEYNR